MPNKPTVMNGGDYIRRVRKEAAKRQLERAAKRTEKRPAPEVKTSEDKSPAQKRT